MRTLKKTLALVLVVAMVLSFGVIGASADFTDVKADNDYKEAIDVLSGIGVINGMTDTTFQPDGSLTRAQAAKIVAYLMLGPKNAEMMSSASVQKFNDVPTSHWASGYIEYCANLGIINGVGDNKFDPEAALSSAAFTKMLLVALGYDAGIENLVGDSWVINVATLAVEADISDSGISVSATRNITRAEACQLAFLTLQAKTVKYKGGSTVEVNGIVINQGATREDVTNSKDNDYRENEDDQDTLLQFCESKFPKLVKTDPQGDAFGRPSAYEWQYDGDKIAGGVDSADYTYNRAITVDEIRDDLGKDYSAANVTVYIDGQDESTNNLKTYGGQKVDTFALKNGDDTYVAGNGTLTEVYKSNGKVTIVIINSYYGSVSNVSNDGDDDRYVTIEDINGVITAGNPDLDFETKSLDEDDIVAFTYSYSANEIKSAELCDEISGTMNSFSSKRISVDGTTYYYSALNTEDRPGDANLSAGDNATIYLDSYGFVLAVKTYDGTTNTASYAYVLAAGETGDELEGGSGVYKARLLYTDGTVETVVTKSNYKDLKGSIVRFSVNSSDKTILTELVEGAGNKKVEIESGKSRFTVEGTGSKTYLGNSSTVYLIATKDKSDNTVEYDAYVGYRNVPDVTVEASANANVAVYCKSGTTATVVFVDATADGSDVSGGKGVETVVFISAQSMEFFSDEDGDFYTYDAVVDGKITTVKTDYNISADTLYTSVVYDGDIITSGTTSSKYVMKGNNLRAIKTTYEAAFDVDTTTETPFIYDSALHSYYVEADGDIVSKSIKSMAGDLNDTVIVLVDEDNTDLITYIFVKEVN